MSSVMLSNNLRFEAEHTEHRYLVKVPGASERRWILAKVVRMAAVFESDILFNAGTFHINGKSPLMAFTLLNALKGQTVEVIARGPDSARAVEDLSNLFERGKDMRRKMDYELEMRHEVA